MMKRFLITALCFGMFSCSHVQTAPVKPPVVPAPVIQPAPKPVVIVTQLQDIKTEHWNVTIPSNWTELPNEEDVVQAYVSPNKEELVTLEEEPFVGSTNQFATSVLEQLASQGAKPVSVSKTHINEQDYIFATMMIDTTVSFVWVTVNNGNGFGLICGGPAFNIDVEKDCRDIANSIE